MFLCLPACHIAFVTTLCVPNSVAWIPQTSGENPLLGGHFTQPTYTLLGDKEASAIPKASLGATSSGLPLGCKFVATFGKGAFFAMITPRQIPNGAQLTWNLGSKFRLGMGREQSTLHKHTRIKVRREQTK